MRSAILLTLALTATSSYAQTFLPEYSRYTKVQDGSNDINVYFSTATLEQVNKGFLTVVMADAESFSGKTMAIVKYHEGTLLKTDDNNAIRFQNGKPIQNNEPTYTVMMAINNEQGTTQADTICYDAFFPVPDLIDGLTNDEYTKIKFSINGHSQFVTARYRDRTTYKDNPQTKAGWTIRTNCDSPQLSDRLPSDDEAFGSGLISLIELFKQHPSAGSFDIEWMGGKKTYFTHRSLNLIALQEHIVTTQTDINQGIVWLDKMPKGDVKSLLAQDRTTTPPPKRKSKLSSITFSQILHNTGCNSPYSEEKREDIFARDYENKAFRWRGVVRKPGADELGMSFGGDAFTFDVLISLSEDNAGYHIEEGDMLTIQFIMRNQGGCILPYSGDNGVILH